MSRLGIVGHSFGGGAVPALAARAAARGMGSEALWLECLAPWYDLDVDAWSSLPAHAHLLAVAFEEDVVCDRAVAARFLERATTIPPERKALLTLRSDAHGTPRLRADHMTPLAGEAFDALDTHGIWRLDDALRDLALTGSAAARARVLGTGPETTALSTWSDDRPVTPLVVGALRKPGEDEARCAWPAGGDAERLARGVLAAGERWSALPLPAGVPASRLPDSERFLRAPPRPPWPDEVEAAAAKGPVALFLAPEDAAVPAALERALPSLAERGVAWARVRATSIPSATGLGTPDGRPTVLLLGRGGTPLLWKRADDPRIVDALADLAR